MEKVVLFDDLDHDQPAEERMPFAIDGDSYIVDLSTDNAKAFREAVEPYRAVAKRVGKHTASRPASSRATRPAGGKAVARAAVAPVTAPAPSSEWYRMLPDDSARVAAKKKQYRKRVRAWMAEQPGRRATTHGVIPGETYRAYEEWAAKNGVATGPESVGL